MSSSGAAMRPALTPIDILRNCRGKPVSIELANGETVNGIVMRTDRAMNVVLKQSIRTGAAGDAFWRARETLVRGASVRSIRMDESVLKATFVSAQTARRGGAAAPSKKRGREGTSGPPSASPDGRRPARKQPRK